MDVGTQQGYHPDNPTHTRSVKHYSRHGIADSPWQVRLDALPSEPSWKHLDNWMWICLHPDWHIRYSASLAGDQMPWHKQWMHSNRTGAHWKLCQPTMVLMRRDTREALWMPSDLPFILPMIRLMAWQLAKILYFASYWKGPSMLGQYCHIIQPLGMYKWSSST